MLTFFLLYRKIKIMQNSNVRNYKNFMMSANRWKILYGHKYVTWLGLYKNQMFSWLDLFFAIIPNEVMLVDLTT